MKNEREEMMKEMREREREKREGRERERKTKMQRERSKPRHGPQTLTLLREVTLEITIGCAMVQAGAFKALAGSAPTKNLPNGLDSLVCGSRKVERENRKRKKKKKACT